MASEAVWRVLCRELNIDPAEVETVAGHYAAYREYTENARGSPLPLENWFRWYHVEKSSEAGELGASPSGCSVDPAAEGKALIRDPDAFLRALGEYVTRR